MHTIVDVIPSLLHLSLFAFFGGLVAFLHPINPALQWLVIGSFIFITAVYTFFTAMPMINLSSPYQTPLSPIIWRTWQSFWWSVEKVRNVRWRLLYLRTRDSDVLPTASNRQYNLTYAMVTASHYNRQQREARSMAWTLKSLNNDLEFLPFIEALPNVIYGVNGKLHSANFHLLKPILETQNSDIDVISRIFSLLVNTYDYWFKSDDQTRSLNAIPDALWSLAFALSERPQDFDLRKTGRSSWFTAEQLRLLERYREHMNVAWMVPVINLIKSNIVMCRELDLPSNDPLIATRPLIPTRPLLFDSEEQGHIVIKYLTDITNALPTQCGMANTTFHTIKGHEAAKKHDMNPIYDGLMKRIQEVVEETKKNSSDGDPDDSDDDDDEWPDSIGDEVGYCLIQLCTKDYVHRICQYLTKRMEVKETNNMLHLWAPTCERENDHIPAYAPFLRALVAHGAYCENCVKALREILWCFDKHPDTDEAQASSTSQLKLNPRWWSDLEPLWIQVLEQLEDLDEDALRPDHHSLAVMIKATVLKKSDPAKPTEPGDDFDLAEAINRHISPFANPFALIRGQLDPLTIRSAFVALVAEQLKYLDPTDSDSLKDAEDTLKFLEYEDLVGAPYEISREITIQLASETRKCCEMWKKNPSSGMLDILKVVWRVWEEAPLAAEKHVPGLDARPRIVPEAASDILRAADILLASYVESPTDETISDDDDDDDEEVGTEATPSKSSLQEYMKRIKAIRRIWDYKSEKDLKETD